MRNKIELICPKCDKPYLKDLSEYNRNKRLNRKSVCSLRCTDSINNIPLDKRSTYDISKHSDNLRDEFTNFRYYLKNIKKSKKVVDVDLQDLKNQWEFQKGICPYTNISLIPNTHNTVKISDCEFPFNYASVDRIDSSKGYVKDNIEFISIGVNYLKNEYSKQQTIDFIEQVIKNKTSLSDLN